MANKRSNNLRVMFFESGEFGGSPQSLANMLKGLRDLGCEVGVVSHFRRTGPVDISSLGCAYYSLDLPAQVRPRRDVMGRLCGIPYLTWTGWRYLHLASRALAAFRPHIAYLNTGVSGHLPAVVSARLLRIPVVSHLRGIHTLSRTDRLCVRFIRQFVALTQWGREYYHGQGIPQRKMVQLYNPFHVSEFDRRSEESVDGPVGKDGAVYVVQVGTLREHKRPDLAIEALKVARRTIPNVKLILAGDGPMRGALAKKVAAEGLADSVKLIGQCQHIPSLLRKCHIGLSVSRGEGQGYCFLEYMAARLPVVTWAMPGIGDEVIMNNRNGIVVSEPSAEAVAEALITLCRSPQLRDALGEAGREIVTGPQYDPKSYVRNVYDLLSTLARCPRELAPAPR